MNCNPAFTIIIIGLTLASITATGTAATTPDRWDDSLTLIIRNSREMQLPCEPLENKIREGRAKNRSAAEIFPVVKARQKLLLQIRDNQQGNFAQGYTKQLFDLERSNSTATQTAGQRLKQPLRTHTPPPVPIKAASINNPEPVEVSSKKKISDPPATSHGNENAQKAEHRLIKADKKAEKTIEKADTRAEQRMKIIEKQMQKRAMKRQGNGK